MALLKGTLTEVRIRIRLKTIASDQHIDDMSKWPPRADLGGGVLPFSFVSHGELSQEVTAPPSE